MQPLTADQQTWVEKTFVSLSPEERLAQLLIPKVDYDSPFAVLDEHIAKIPYGGLFVWGSSAQEHKKRLAHLQSKSRVPIVVAADLENGAGYVIEGAVKFPDMLAVAAAGREDLAYAMGKAAALEGRAVGIHWTFAPVVDVNVNPDNPIANTRCLGDDPDRIGRLATAILRGMQENGLAACAKHFPGDGVDDIDQHFCTSVNSLSLEQWKKISGRTFGTVFSAGVWSAMIGHIALPAWDGERDRRGAYRPATLSRRILADLLRGEMGFQGLVVTDDMNMGGAAGYANHRDRTIGCIAAGCDMILFPRIPGDYEILLGAVRSGELKTSCVDESCRRVLEFKARLGFHRGEIVGREPTAQERSEFEQANRQIAESGIACVRDFNRQLPVQGLRKGDRVMTVTLTNDGLEPADVDRELAARGFQVVHITNPHCGEVDQKLDGIAAVFVNFTFRANWGVGSPRSIGPHNRMFMNGFHQEHPRVIFTSFGSPYHLRQFVTLPNYVNVHSLSAESQRAAVRAWFGEIPMTAKSPVGNLTREIRVG